MKAKVDDVGMEMCVNDSKWVFNTILFTDDTVLIAENDRDPQKLVNVFDTVCKRQKLKVNRNKSNIMVFERSKGKVVDIDCPYRERVEYPKECEIRLTGEKWRKFMSLSNLLRLCASVEAWKVRQGSCAREESDWMSRVYDERKDSKHGGKIGTACWNNCFDNHMCK